MIVRAILAAITRKVAAFVAEARALAADVAVAEKAIVAKAKADVANLRDELVTKISAL